MNLQLRSLRSLLASVGAIHLATAALGTLVALEIAETGGSQEAASLVAASYSMGFLAGCFFISKPLARIGHIRAFAAAAAICTISSIILFKTDSTFATVLVRLVTGLATAGLYAIGDAWINDSAGPLTRGRLLAVYSIVLGMMSVFSQAVVASYEDALSESFVAVGAVYCIAIVVLATTRTEPPAQQPNASVRLMAVYQASPTAFLGAVASGIVVVLLLNVIPYRASSVGVSSSTIALGVAAVFAGRVIVQYPLGKLSDRFDRRIVIAGVSAASAALFLLSGALSPGGAAILEGEDGFMALVRAVFGLALLGGSLLSLYSVLVAHAMDRTGTVEVASTAITMLFIYSVGCVVGPLIAAVVTTALGDAAVTWLAFAVMFAFAGFTVFRIKKRAAADISEHTSHVPSPTTSIEMSLTKAQ